MKVETRWDRYKATVFFSFFAENWFNEHTAHGAS